jgi:hypothetical protein
MKSGHSRAIVMVKKVIYAKAVIQKLFRVSSGLWKGCSIHDFEDFDFFHNELP